MNVVEKFVFDFMRIKQNFINGSNKDIRERQMKLLFLTIKYYSHNKKKILNEDFESQKISEFEKFVEAYENDNNSSDDCSTEESSDSNDSISEYEFSDADEIDTQNVNALMACAEISLRRARQSKIGIYLNKKHTFDLKKN